jgi:phosphoribosylformylglycinamidine cyclo-ligase
MMHVTGGAYTKLKDLLGCADVKIKRGHKLQPQPIFRDLYNRGIRDEEMYKTFNCGIGFILSVSLKDADKIVSELDDADIIGEVTPGSGKIRIESMFSNKEIGF